MMLISYFFLLYYRTRLRLLQWFSLKKAASEAFILFTTPLPVKQKTPAVLPEGAETLAFQFDQETVRGFRWQNPGRRRVLILHGFSSNLNKFMHYVDPLKKAGFEVLLFNAPAHGNSTGKTFNVLQYRDMIHKVAETYGPIQNFIAHSFGGLALSLYTESLKEQNQLKLVLIAPATETSTAIDQFATKLKISNRLKTAMKDYIFQKSGIKAEDFSVRKAMHHIKAPVLWIHDLDDAVTPWKDAAAVQSDRHPNIYFINTRGLGHRKIYKDSEVAAKVIRYITDSV
jgi:alpha-beta hydrolase superfamily lysophospholipase